MRLLHGARPREDRLEVDLFAVVLGALVGPDRLHRLDAFAHQAEAAIEIRAVVLHLLAVPAAADPEQEATVRDAIEACHFLREGERIALDDERDAGAELQRPGRRGRCREADEGVHHLVVVGRHVAARREGALPRGRDVGVLAHPHRFEAALLERRAELGGVHRVVGGKGRDTYVHRVSFPHSGWPRGARS